MANTHETLTSLFSDIANAIRAKTGRTSDIVADNFPNEIGSIPKVTVLEGDVSVAQSGVSIYFPFATSPRLIVAVHESFSSVVQQSTDVLNCIYSLSASNFVDSHFTAIASAACTTNTDTSTASKRIAGRMIATSSNLSVNFGGTSARSAIGNYHYKAYFWED